MNRSLHDRIRVLEVDARLLFESSLAGVSPETLVRKAFDQFDLSSEVSAVQRCFLISCGKAAVRMTAEFLRLLAVKPRIALVVSPHGTDAAGLRGAEFMTSAHPVPDDASMRASNRALEVAGEAQAGDLLIVLISGGGSSLWAGLPEGLTLEDLQQTVSTLLVSGATIRELNTVRKHLSTIKGGRLAAAAAPARVVTFIISDVVGNPIDVVASGPTVPDPTTYSDAIAVLERRGGRDVYPQAVVRMLEDGRAGRRTETPKSGSHVFVGNDAYVIGSNMDAVRAAEARAAFLGYATHVMYVSLTGEARTVGAAIGRHLRDNPVETASCLLWSGETTVSVTGGGLGGRNQELALSAALELDGADVPGVLLSGGTDGIDGPTDAAGAVVSSETVAEGKRHGLQAQRHLEDNDSYPFLKACGAHVVTGPTGTNVMDIQIALLLPVS